jgi:hypothetical protein
MRLLLPLLLIAYTASAQFPNQGFENWTGAAPDSWMTNNVPGISTPITKSSTAYKGSFALRGDVVTFMTVAMGPVLNAGVGAKGFAVTNRPGSIQGYYQFAPQGNDEFSVAIFLYKGGVGGTLVAGAGATFSGAHSTYTQFSVPFEYLSTDTPDICTAIFTVSNPDGTLHTGTYFLLDEVTLSATGGTAVQISEPMPVSFELGQNYPNPFNPSTTFSFSLPTKSRVTLTVYDAFGREAAGVFSGEMPAGRHSLEWNASGLPSGMYFYRLKAGAFSETKRLLLLK